MKIEYLNGFKTLKLGKYVVQTRKDDFHGIYYISNGELLIHRKTWKQATKIASLLEKAYNDGYNDAKDLYYDYEDDYYYDD